MNARRRIKALLKQTFPSLWVRWHLMHHPKSAEQELQYLDKIVPGGAVTVDVGANCGLYTRELARLSRKVYAFEPSHQMADILRKTSAPNVSVHEIALSDQSGSAELFIPQGEHEPIYGLASLEPAVGTLNRDVVSVQRADGTARCDCRPGRCLREDRCRGTRVERAERRGRTLGALPAGLPGRSGGPPPRCGDPVDLRVLCRQEVSRLLPQGRQRGPGRPVPFRKSAGRPRAASRRRPPKRQGLRQQLLFLSAAPGWGS